MARIHSRVDGDDYYHVNVHGILRAAEVRLLEGACGRALEHRRLRLTVDLDEAHVPPAACLFLCRLLARGATLTGIGRDSVLDFQKSW